MNYTSLFFRQFIFLCCAAVLAACGSSSDSNSTSNTSSDTRHRIFVTDTTYNGNLGGLIGADITCTNVASAAGISGSYQAVLSSTLENANSRIVISGDVYLLDVSGETIISTSSSAFWNNNHLSPININETGVTLLVMEEPWTGTNPGGAVSNANCSDWTDGTASTPTSLGATGDSSATDSALWVNANGFTCDSVRPLYCIEQ